MGFPNICCGFIGPSASIMLNVFMQESFFFAIQAEG